MGSVLTVFLLTKKDNKPSAAVHVTSSSQEEEPTTDYVDTENVCNKKG